MLFSSAEDYASDVNLFSRTVDGQQVSWGLAYIQTFARFDPLSPGALVPEPSTLLLGCVGASGLLRRRR